LLARAMRQLVSNARTACNAPGAEKFMVWCLWGEGHTEQIAKDTEASPQNFNFEATSTMIWRPRIPILIVRRQPWRNRYVRFYRGRLTDVIIYGFPAHEYVLRFGWWALFDGKEHCTVTLTILPFSSQIHLNK
jgi:hypothetical protein